jgi:hypothetical protein
VPITGGVWEEFTLVSDGRSLSLLRDGRLVARRDGLTLDDLAPATHVVIGYQEGHLIGHSTNDNARRATRGVIDDVRLERIGSGLSANLPGDMQPSADATITCFPDGRVRVNGADAGDITVWSRNDTTLKAIVSIAAGGAVTVKKIEP